MWKEVITRFAPSPTGSLHIGGARTALFNWLYARKFKGKFLLRIEDTDAMRSSKEAVQTIIQGLQWLNLHWDNSVIYQKDRFDRHKEIADILLKDGKAYKCYSSREEIEEHRAMARRSGISTIFKSPWRDRIGKGPKNQKFVVRLKAPEHGATNIKDQIMGNLHWKNDTLDDLIILRQDSSPTYMLAVVVDDHDLGINYIIRGDDHFINTFRQYYIYKFMNWDVPQYAHIPLIHGEDGTKLSKRHGAVNILDLKKDGYLKEAIINNLILLGWSNNQEKSETIELEEIIENFEISNLSKSSSIFSFDKLDFFNNFYLRKENGIEKFINFCESDVELNKYLQKDETKMKNIFNVYKKDIKKLSDLNDTIKVYFDENYKINKTEKLTSEFDSIFKEFLNLIGEINDWNRDNIQNVINDFLKNNKIKFPVLGKPIRFLLINSYQGPSISDIFVILGKKDTIDRLNQYRDN